MNSGAEHEEIGPGHTNSPANAESFTSPQHLAAIWPEPIGDVVPPPQPQGAVVVSLPLDSSPVVGFLESVSDEGWAFGWAWYPDHPGERVEIEVLVDGEPVDSFRSASFRADVAEAGRGDGYYGFAWPLPYAVLARPRDALISVRAKRTGQVLPKPWIFRQRLVAQADQRINELESELRLLNARIAELSRRGQQEETATTSLFKLVGAFFTELAQASAAGEMPRQMRSLNNAVAEMTAGFTPFSFLPCVLPNVTVFVVAGGSARATYETLQAVHDTIGATAAEVYLLDEGVCDDTALLPSIVQNMRYARLTSGDAVARYNDAARLAKGSTLVFLAPGMTPQPGWALALSAFQADARLAALAARITGSDGEILSAGVALHDGAAILRGPRMDAAALAQDAVIDAVAGECFALRQASWLRLGGLNESFTSIAAALLDFCQRAKAAGETVSYGPGFCARLTGALARDEA